MARVGLLTVIHLPFSLGGCNVRTSSGGMEIRKSHALLSYLIDVRRADLAAKAANVGEAQIISDNNEEIRSFTHFVCSDSGQSWTRPS
jgi:hypothetical protein